jgi:hypothetical protein
MWKTPPRHSPPLPPAHLTFMAVEGTLRYYPRVSSAAGLGAPPARLAHEPVPLHLPGAACTCTSRVLLPLPPLGKSNEPTFRASFVRPPNKRVREMGLACATRQLACTCTKRHCHCLRSQGLLPFPTDEGAADRHWHRAAAHRGPFPAL